MQKVDAQLYALYSCQAQKKRVELALRQAEEGKGGFMAKKPEVLRNQLEKLQAKEAALQVSVAACRETSLHKSEPCQAFFATFRTAKAAAMATELNVNPLHWRGMHLLRAPDPENVNFTMLQRSWWERALRAAITLIPIIAIMLFPIGAITGAFSQLEAALCGGEQGQKGSLSGTWFCSDEFFAKLLLSVLTGVLPSVLMTVYQAVVLPIYMMTCAQAESQSVSLSALDLRCASLFYYWNLFNFFVGALLGGTIFNGLRDAIANPRNIIPLLGSAVPASANFFINYVMYRALAMTCFRLFYPHACVGADIAKWFRVLPSESTALLRFDMLLS